MEYNHNNNNDDVRAYGQVQGRNSPTYTKLLLPDDFPSKLELELTLYERLYIRYKGIQTLSEPRYLIGWNGEY